MSILVKYASSLQLKKTWPAIKAELIKKLEGRVQAAYLFGSVARGDFRDDSDIDLILVKSTEVPFTKRPFEFEDLLDLYPKIDILVYTQAELDEQLKLSTGFWKEIARDMRPLY